MLYGIGSLAKNGAHEWLTATARVVAAVLRMLAGRAGKSSSRHHVKNNNKKISASKA